MRLLTSLTFRSRRAGAGICGLLVFLFLPGIGSVAASSSGVDPTVADPEVFAVIEKALAEADEGAVLAYAGRQVSLTFLGRGTLYSKNQAVYVLRDFFEDHPPGKFAFKEYSSTDDRSFAFGVYTVRDTGETMDVTVNLRRRGDRWELGELRIEAR